MSSSCVLTDRGSEYWGNPEQHEYELYLAVEDVDVLRRRAHRPMGSVNDSTRPCSTNLFNGPATFRCRRTSSAGELLRFITNLDLQAARGFMTPRPAGVP